jgi:hypothetical protein
MKNVLFLLSTTLFLFSIEMGCMRNTCDDFPLVNLDSEAKKYFLVYSRTGDNLIFSSGSSNDTINAKLSQVFLDTVCNFGSGGISEGQGVNFSGKIFNDTTLFVGSAANRNGSITFISAPASASPFQGIMFNRNQQKFELNPGDKFIDSLKVSNTMYYNVMELISVQDNITLYFAPNKGLIKWINKNKIYNLK